MLHVIIKYDFWGEILIIKYVLTIKGIIIYMTSDSIHAWRSNFIHFVMVKN